MCLATDRRSLSLYEVAQNDCSASRAALECYEVIGKFRRIPKAVPRLYPRMHGSQNDTKETSPNVVYAYRRLEAYGSWSATDKGHSFRSFILRKCPTRTKESPGSAEKYVPHSEASVNSLTVCCTKFQRMLHLKKRSAHASKLITTELTRM